jgi:uncharacterized membrane protein
MSESGQPSSQNEDTAGSSLPAPSNLEAMLRDVAPEALKSISPENLEKLKGAKAVLIKSERHTHTEFSMTHSGPLPPPSYLAQYNEIIPQGADRLMKQVENQSAHRIAIEKGVVEGQGKRESNGQWFGFIIALVGLACGTYVIISGHAVAGCTICGSPLLGIVSVFVYSRQQGASERKQKQEQMAQVNPAVNPPVNKRPQQQSGNQRRRRRR